ncbi:phage antirepressor N-terminal domain-containing protein [Oscillochloris sp. ZM17-4]|uniref:phage antirepressor N-terminal domain-containing protein n=1 Tax=Oscillochloris sp. ZM17-4 TaxID=2866714 RepID=UPI001C730512|nr:phage antirepressor N-terminal domain-containing protein [Oscillochloris sp. ZM17-4]MBX0326962.1 phage antirepressor N-terminal domain-containing protein [Oscillochloris sp. ZM17-4]
MNEETEAVEGMPRVTAITQRAVEFYGDNLVAVQAEGGIYVPVKRVCEALGIDWESQRQRIMRDEVLNSVACVIQATGTDGKRYDMVCLPDDMLHGWLFGVSAERIKPENREQLLRYKRECYRRLHESFTGADISATRLAALEARLAALEARRGPAPAATRAALPEVVSSRVRPRERTGRMVYRRVTERITEIVELVDIPEAPRTESVLAALRQAGRPLRPREITALLQAAGLEVVPVQVSQALWALEQAGRVIRQDDGAYRAEGGEG